MTVGEILLVVGVGICGVAIIACFVIATLYYGRVLPLPQKKTYIVYIDDHYGNTSTMVVNTRSARRVTKVVYKTFHPTVYNIKNIVDAEEVFDVLRVGDKNG